MIYYKLVKVIINILKSVEVIFNIVVIYYSSLDSIISNYAVVFTLKSSMLLYYFFGIMY